MPQVEYENYAPIFDEMGRSVNFGWARNPVFKYDPTLVWAARRYITEFERYFIFNPTHLFVFEVFDGGLIGHIRTVAVSLLDRKIVLKTEKINFPMRKLNLPSDVTTESVHIKRNSTKIDFIVMNSDNKISDDRVTDRTINRIIKVDVPGIKHNLTLRGEIVLSAPFSAELIAANSSWKSQKNSFQFLQSSPWYSAEGVMQFENTGIFFNGRNAFGIHNLGRIARPAQDIHYWAAGCGLFEDRQISFNIGYGLADSSLGSENAFFVNGKIHKLDVVTFKIPAENWMLPWYFKSNDNRLELTFKPVQLFTSRFYMLFYTYRLVQVFGFFSGRVILDDGNEIKFKNITGVAERKTTKN